MHPTNGRTRPARFLGATVLGVAIVAGSLHFRVSPVRFAQEIARFAVLRAAGVLLRGDAADARARSAVARVGVVPAQSRPVVSWENAAFAAPALSVQGGSAFGHAAVPAFVWEDPDAAPLARLREECGLGDVVAAAASEYEAQLRLGGWILARIPGTPRAHVVDDPGRVEPLEVLRRAEQGKQLCCDTVSTLAIHAAAALGWPARRVVVTRRGAEDARCVAELWSNELHKWYVLDVAYNQVFELDGRPLSAFELCRDGPDLPRSGRLQVRRIGPAARADVPAAAPSFSYIHLDAYGYVRVDLRNDWLSRPLRRGSPASGERNTMWTARAGRPPLLTCSRREDRRPRFDWPINSVEIHALEAALREGGAVEVTLGLSAYAPYFESFALALDDGPWWDLEEPRATLLLSPGAHRIAARVRTRGGPGPVYEALVRVQPGSPVAVGRARARA